MLNLNEELYNKTKHRLQDGGKACGAWVQAASPITAEVMARAGFDFLVIDNEHGPGDTMTLVSQIQACSHYGTDIYVRVPWTDFVTIKKTLDAGATGIHVPYVNTREEAELAVRACKYPKDGVPGIRGIAGSPRAVGYGLNTANYLQKANDEILVYVALETPQAIDNLDEIMKVDGVDGIFIGPMDLSTSMGYFASPMHPEVQKKIAEVEKKVLGSGKFLGTVAGSFERAQELYDRGYQYLLTLSDTTTLSSVCRSFVTKFQEAYPEK